MRCDKSGATKVGKREKWGETKVRHEKSGGKEKSGTRNVRCDKSGATKVGKREKWGETKVRRAKSGARKVGHR